MDIICYFLTFAFLIKRKMRRMVAKRRNLFRFTEELNYNVFAKSEFTEI